MITYNDLYEAARKERYSDQLQPLPKNFITEIAEYLKEKKQLENAITLFRELMIRRRKKILNLVLIASETGISKQDFDNMLFFEKSLFEEFMKNIEISDKELNELLSERKMEKLKNELIMFKADVGQFLDREGEKIGPFEKGQIANIPKDVAKILVDDGKAEVIEK